MVKDKITSRDSRIDRWLESLGLAGCAIGLGEDEMETPAVFNLVAPFPASQGRLCQGHGTLGSYLVVTIS